MISRNDLEACRMQLIQALEEHGALEVRIARLRAQIQDMELELARWPAARTENPPVALPFSLENLGPSDLAWVILAGSGSVMTVDEVFDAFRAAGRPEDRSAVNQALVYLVDKRKAVRPERGKYIKR